MVLLNDLDVVVCARMADARLHSSDRTLMPMDILALLNTGMLRESWTSFSCSSSERPVVQTTMGSL